MCAGPDMLRGVIFFVSSILPGFYDLSNSYSEEFPESWGGFGGEIPFMIECPNVSHYCPVVDLCICSHLLKKKASLMLSENDNNQEYN